MKLTKHCSGCGHDYPATPAYWHRNRTRGDGWQIYCKPCQRERVYGGANRERTRLRNKAHYHAHVPERRAYAQMYRRERMTEATRARLRHNQLVYYYRHHAARLAYQAGYRARKTEAMRVKDRAYALAYYYRNKHRFHRKKLASG